MANVNKEQALQEFFEGFGWPVYDEGTIPDGAPLPRITYMMASDSLDSPLSVTASLWDRSYSWKSVTEKKDEIAAYLYMMDPPTVPFTGGRIYIWPGKPFSQRMIESSDGMIRRLYLNFEVEYFSAY